jgi:hypothetical protein
MNRDVRFDIAASRPLFHDLLLPGRQGTPDIDYTRKDAAPTGLLKFVSL